MYLRPFFLTLVMAVSSCGPVQVFHKPGATVSRLNSDLSSCQVAALRDAPVATEVRQGPPRYIPERRYCDSSGRCYSRGGYWLEGNLYTVDVNESLRNRLNQQCMGGKGYQPVELRRCSQSVAAQVPPQGNRALPQLTDTSCVIRRDNGEYEIVNTVAG